MDELGQARFVDWYATVSEVRDPFGKDVANHDRMPALGEAGRGDEADPAGADDSERLRHLPRV
jgi:hypothetical protein